MQRFFNVNKVGVFVDSYSPGVEKRRGDEVPVLTVNCRIQPFDSKLASSLDEGVGEDSNIRATVFSLNTGDPKPNFTRHDFKLGIERQNMELFASPDTHKSRVSLNQARIHGCYVRTQKDMNSLALVFKATLGPVGRDELEMVHSLHRKQTFVNFTQAEPLLDTESDGDDAITETDEKARKPVDGRGAPSWTDGDQPPAEAESDAAREVGENRPLHSHQSRKRGGTKPTGPRAVKPRGKKR